jgi:DNA transformation protein
MSPEDPIENLVGIGPKSGPWLRAVGMATRGDLAEAGPAEAYVRVVASGIDPNLNLLWALAGAAEDMHWTLIPPRRREQLKKQVEAMGDGTGLDE